MIEEIHKSRKLYLEKVYTQLDFRRKECSTKKERNGFRISNRENLIYEVLKKFYSNIEREYFDERFPFRCDFYIPEKDLFIEYQGFWTHGKHPFDEKNKKDLEILKKWKSSDQKIYKNGIDVWSIKDPIKRTIAQKNQINYLEIFDLKINEEKIKNILENFNRSFYLK